ncbi:MAG: tRNA (N(6)-L-threonylcarbamoyladenosine(37)-C(2))-methylthiotransferase MtaB, partial [Candidatus Krumholzibacteriaceae bacterium]
TLGCKLNQFESQCIREALQRRHWVYRRFEDGASFYIINSCTVTRRSDGRCRNAVRRTRKTAPGSFIVVTGCYAETQRERLEANHEIDLVVGNGAKSRIPAILDEIAARGESPVRGAPGAVSGAGPLEDGRIERFLDHSRAFVKVQDGCDAACSYCIVPRARGAGRSVPADKVLSQVRLLRDNGYGEIVLTGVHIGRYGADLRPASTLASLVEEILERTESLRIRLSSIEPTEVTPKLLALVRRTERVAPHFHVPLQSGDDRILAAMNRPYRAADFRDLIAEIARTRDGVAIGTDIIVGFPGETDERFERTFSLVGELPLCYLHVFGFSPRPLTPAAAMGGAVSAVVKKARSSRLIGLGAAKRGAFLASQIGTRHESVVEGAARNASSFVRTLTGNYCEVFVPRAGLRPGALVPVRIERMMRGDLYGAPVGLPEARERESETGVR